MSKPIIQLNEENVKSELKELVRSSVEETLNELLNKEAEELTSAAALRMTLLGRALNLDLSVCLIFVFHVLFSPWREKSTKRSAT